MPGGVQGGDISQSGHRPMDPFLLEVLLHPLLDAGDGLFFLGRRKGDWNRLHEERTKLRNLLGRLRVAQGRSQGFFKVSSQTLESLQVGARQARDSSGDQEIGAVGGKLGGRGGAMES